MILYAGSRSEGACKSALMRRLVAEKCLDSGEFE